MKNPYFKNALVSGVIAVFLGVLLLGVNAVFGDAPTYEPPGSGVSPTFTGLTVTAGGTIESSMDDLYINDNLTITGDSETQGDAIFKGDLFITPNLADVNKGNLTVRGFSDLQGVLKNTVGDVTVFDTFRVNGNSEFFQPIGNGSAGPLSINDDLYISGTTNFGSSLFNSAGSLYIDDDVALKALEIQGWRGELPGGNEIKIVDEAPQIEFEDTNGNDYWLHVNDGRFYVLWDEGDDGDWDSPHPLYFQGRNAYFGGNVSANKFGNVFKNDSGYTNYNSSSWTNRSKDLPCGDGNIVLSCWYAAYYDNLNRVSMRNVYIDGNTCKFDFQTNSEEWIDFHSVCWDPNATS